MAAGPLCLQHGFMDASVRPASTLDPESLAWITRLGPQSNERPAAVEELRALLLRAAQFELGRRRAALRSLSGDERGHLAERCAEDALFAVLEKLDDFRGRSRFTTWAGKFALVETAVQVRRVAWQSRDVPAAPQSLPRPDTMASAGSRQVETSKLSGALKEAIDRDLTPHQRDVLLTLTLNDVPIDVLAERLNTTRGALYQTVYEARQKLRRALVSHDIELDQPQPEPAVSTRDRAGFEETTTTSRGGRLALRVRSRLRNKNSARP